MKRRILALLLAIALFATFLPTGVFAAQTDAPASINAFGENPRYPAGSAKIPEAPESSGNVSTYATYHSTTTAAGKELRGYMEDRDTSFNLYYKIPVSKWTSSGLQTLIESIIDKACAHTGVPTQGDYLGYQYGAWNTTTYHVSTTSDGNYYNARIEFNMSYYSTAAQEKTVDNKVASLLSSLNPKGTNYQKIKKVYDWMCDNIEYDWENMGDINHPLQWTAYGAIVDKCCVCQGYAVLLYRLALEMGIDCRIIRSIESENHVWNIISMGNLYYNADATWDAGAPSYNWFLLSDANFVDHTRDAEYKASSFYDDYPMGKYNYNFDTAARITTQPKSVGVVKGETAKVTLKATGNDLTYKWYFKDADASKFSLTTSFTGNSYSVKMNADRAGRKVYCKVTDKYGNTVKSNTVTLSMATPLKITQQPKNVTVGEGETAKVTLKASGDGLTYKWYFKNAGDTKYTYTSSFKSNSYSVKMTEARDGRRVLCKVYDKWGNMVQSESVVIKMAEPVKITTQPKSVTVAKGETAKVTLKATGDGLVYKWYFKNPGESKYTYTSTFTSNYYKVTMTAARDGRRVLCKVYDKYGNMVQSNSVTLNMK